ncbi:MAG: 1-aminocyclopropane-1-carboxylate deaminase [Paraglaciecola sp.]|jgi:1-aminocyclopropane-1-carboxylate deaminase
MSQHLKTMINTLELTCPSPEQRLKVDWPNSDNYQIWLKRDDLLHPIVSGNKWRKLKYALLAAKHNNVPHIISFGGGFSNHLHALGYACSRLGIQLTAIVRGDYSAHPSPMLEDLARWHAKVQYVDRQTYRLRSDADYLAQLSLTHPGAMIIPEGGSQHSALAGVMEIIDELGRSYDHILAPVASGGTLAGLIHATRHINTTVTGIAVLKGQGYLEDLVTELLPSATKPGHHWDINHDHHFGGYAKSTPHLSAFCAEFYTQTHIPIEPVYSGKLFYAAKALISEGAFTRGAKILLLHTGGLQGARTA